MTNQDIAWLGIESLAQLIRTRKLSATEVAQAMLRRIEQIDPRLHAFGSRAGLRWSGHVARKLPIATGRHSVEDHTLRSRLRPT